jgi:uncharacterized protein
MPQDHYEDTLALIQAHDYEGAVALLICHMGSSRLEAWHKIAAALFTGTGVEKREDDAIQIWRRQSQEDDADSQQVLGAVLVRRDSDESILEGVDWLEKAASQGKVHAITTLGQIYFGGQGPVAANPKLCTDYFQKAVDLNDTESMITLAQYYKIGFGVAQSDSKYMELNEQAANAGNAKGNYNLGVAYEFGYYGHVNDELAFKHYFIAANEGIPQAQHNLGARYFNGKGVTQNKHQGITWYLHAAAAGSELSQHCLGLIFLDGDGVEGSDVSALSWFLMAVEQGAEESTPFVDKLTAKLSEADIAQAQEMAATFKNRWQTLMSELPKPDSH